VNPTSNRTCPVARDRGTWPGHGARRRSPSPWSPATSPSLMLHAPGPNGAAERRPRPVQSASSGAAEPRTNHRVAVLRNETKRPAPHGFDPVESRPASLVREGRADSAQGPCSASALVRAELRAPAARALPLPPLPRRGAARPNLTARPSGPPQPDGETGLARPAGSLSGRHWQ
jgi:hypothetical protein